MVMRFFRFFSEGEEENILRATMSFRNKLSGKAKVMICFLWQRDSIRDFY